MNPLALKVENLHRSFGSKRVLRDVSFEMGVGEFVVIKGANGSGKTTLLRILAALTQPDQGRVFIMGERIDNDRKKVRSLVGWAAATDGGFVARLTGLQNLRLFAGLDGISTRTFESALEELKSFTVLHQALNTPFYLCSAGMKQSLQIARVLIKNPRLLLLDEPARSLDETSVQELTEILFRKRGQTSMLVAIHGQSVLETLSDRTLSLQSGGVA
jgi:ABC-2 type transport system ATP-binding protein